MTPTEWSQYGLIVTRERFENLRAERQDGTSSEELERPRRGRLLYRLLAKVIGGYLAGRAARARDLAG